jgi:hypothetical protein
MPLTQEGRRLRAQLGALQRYTPTDTPTIETVRRRLRYEAAAGRVLDLHAMFPELLPEDRARLAELLRGGAA